MLSQPQLAHYVAGWPRPGDLGVIALDGQQFVGAAWVRLLPESDPGYGFVDATTPELSMGVMWAWRGRGIGSRLLRGLIAAARDQGLASLSLLRGLVTATDGPFAGTPEPEELRVTRSSRRGSPSVRRREACNCVRTTGSGFWIELKGS